MSTDTVQDLKCTEIEQMLSSVRICGRQWAIRPVPWTKRGAQ